MMTTSKADPVALFKVAEDILRDSPTIDDPFIAINNHFEACRIFRAIVDMGFGPGLVSFVRGAMDAADAALAKIVPNYDDMAYPAYLTTPHWVNLAEHRKSKDGYKCILCDAETALEVHHKRYKDENGASLRGRESLDDLVTLCHSCHGKYHGKEAA